MRGLIDFLENINQFTTILIGYNIIVVYLARIGVGFDSPLIEFILPSRRIIGYTISDLFLLLGHLALLWEIFARLQGRGPKFYWFHVVVLDFGIFVIYLLEFLLIPFMGHHNFFFLVILSLLNSIFAAAFFFRYKEVFMERQGSKLSEGLVGFFPRLMLSALATLITYITFGVGLDLELYNNYIPHHIGVLAAFFAFITAFSKSRP